MKTVWMHACVAGWLLMTSAQVVVGEDAADTAAEAPAPAANQQLFEQVMQLRRANGLDVQEADEQLMKDAQDWAEHLAATGSFYHKPGRPEIIAYSGGGPNNPLAVNMWYNSGAHRVLMFGSWRKCGYGVAHRNGTTYYCGVFGSTWTGGTTQTVTTGSYDSSRRRGFFRRRR